MSGNRVPMVQLGAEEIERARAFALGRAPSEAARALRLDEQTVFRVLSGYPVHRATATVVRSFLSGAGGGRI